MPIVIIQSSIRGAPVETWTSRGYLEKTGDFSKQIAVLNTLTSTSRDWFVYKDYTNWMSIPQSDLDKNSKLIQNPGY